MRKKKEQTFIYALKDPRDNCIRYVGRSDNPTDRYHRHVYDATPNRYKARWMQGLLNSGYKPRLIILEKVDVVLRLEAEKHWIDLGYQRGWPLTNIFMFRGNKGDSIFLDEKPDEIRWDYISEDIMGAFDFDALANNFKVDGLLDWELEKVELQL